MKADRHPRRRFVVFLVVSFFGVAGLLVLLAPSILSTGFGRGIVEKLINTRVAGAVTADALSFSWTGKQTVSGLTIRDPEGATVAVIGRMENDRGLWALLTGGKYDLGTTKIDGLRIDLAAGDDGRTNLLRALASPSSSKGGGVGAVPVLPFGLLVVSESQVTVSAPGMEKVEFRISGIELQLPGPETAASVRLVAETRQGDLTGDLRVEGQVEDLVDDGGRLQPMMARVDLTVEADSLPVDGIDQAFGFKGQLAAALGRELDLRVRTRAALPGAQFDFHASSSNLRADLKMDLVGVGLELRESADIHFTLTPFLVKILARSGGRSTALSLAGDVPLLLRVDSLHFPLSAFDPSRSGFRAHLTAAAAADFTGVGEAGDLTVREFSASFDAESLTKPGHLELAADLVFDGQPGSLRVNGDFTRLFNERKEFNPLSGWTEFSGEMKKMPTSFVGALAGRPALIGAILGDHMDVRLAARSSGAERQEIDLSISSPRLEAEFPLLLTDRMALSRPAKIRADIRPEAVALLFPDTPPVKLRRFLRAEIEIARFGTGQPAVAGHFSALPTVVDAVLVSNLVELETAAVGGVDVEKLRLHVKAENLEAISIEGTGIVELKKESVLSESVGGEPLSFGLEARTGLSGEGDIEPVEGTIRLESGTVKVAAEWRIGPPFERVELISPASISYFVPNRIVARIFPGGPDKMVPKPPLSLTVVVDPVVLPLRDFSPAATVAKATVTVPKIELAENGGAVRASLREVTARFILDGPGGVLQAVMSGKPSLPGGGGDATFAADFTMKNVIEDGKMSVEAASLEGNFRVVALPVALAALFFGGAERLASLAGGEVTAEGNVRLAPLRGGDGELMLKASFPRLEVEAALLLGETIRLKGPAVFRLDLTPASYAALMSPPPESDVQAEAARRFVLAERTVVAGKIAALRWPHSVVGASVDASAGVEKMRFREKKTGREIGIEGLTVRLLGADLSRELKIDLGGRIIGPAEGRAAAAGSLEAGALLSDLFDADGRFAGDRLSVKSEVKASKVPVDLVDEWLGLGGMGRAALGDSLDLTASMDIGRGSGPLQMTVDASHARLELDGSLREGVLTLKKPLVGEMKVTEELGLKILNRIHPIFETVRTSREPLRLEIGAAGFALPLKDFDITRVAVPEVKIFSNRLLLKKGGLLGSLIALSQSFGGMKGIGGGETELWFTDVVAELRDGVFSYRRRIDLLIEGRLHALSWGTATFGGESAGRSSYDLVLALPEDALRKVLGTKRISPGEMLVIPIRGREGTVDMKGAFSRASLDLGRVRGQYELTKKDALLGALAGALTRKVIGTDTGPVPPPSMSPLPWAALTPPAEAIDAPPPPAEVPAPAPLREKQGERSVEEDVKELFNLFK